MSGTATAQRGRALAERQMTSTCRIFTPGAPVTDPDTGEVTYAGTDVYVGPCRVRPAGTQDRGGESGGAQLSINAYVISVPFSATGIRAKQRVELLTSPDPDLPGVQMEIVQPPKGDSITARRLLCEEVA